MAARTRKIELDEGHKDSIRATQLLNVLTKHANSKRGKLDSTRIAAARAALPFLRPALSSIEQTVHNADDQLTEEQLMAKFQALIEAHPDLLQRLLAMQARAKPGIAAQQSDDSGSTEPVQVAR